MKDAAEITAVREADIQCDLGDRLLAVSQQGFCLIDPVALEVGDRRGAEFLAETEGQMVFGNTDVPRDIAARD